MVRGRKEPELVEATNADAPEETPEQDSAATPAATPATTPAPNTAGPEIEPASRTTTGTTPAAEPAPLPYISIAETQAGEDSAVCQLLRSGITIDTYWKNAPPKNCNVMWAYSSHKCRDYYFMSSVNSDYLERKFQKGYSSADINSCQTVMFATGQQRSSCGGIDRNVRRITAKHYQDLMNEYRNFFNKREVLWCLKCKKSYVLYSPGYQQLLDVAYRDGDKLLRVNTNDCYTYEIDPRRYTQKNLHTGKIREIARVYRNHNDMPIYGAYHLKIDVATSSSIMERSCIYYV